MTIWAAIVTAIASSAVPPPGGTVDRLEALRRLYVGEAVSDKQGLDQYTGRAAVESIVGDDRKQAYRSNYVQLYTNYGETADFQLRREQVVLCPQTAGYLYSAAARPAIRHVTGSRPRLEDIVAKAAGNCVTEADRALALMRYCRDLYNERWYTEGIGEYVYGGTEEQLIEKGEILCECLGRLHVALCEVAGIPGRIVMHVIGGHICSEVFVDGAWAYMDPRCGVYFRKADGALASVWDLWRDPSVIRRQSEQVKTDVSRWFTWEERAWKCEHKYFALGEINGFQNYSLADSGRYAYTQKTHAEALDHGLLLINKDYCDAANRVFGLAPDGMRAAFGTQPLRRIPIAYRHDGFSPFFRKPPFTVEQLYAEYVDPLANTNATISVWGLGPGSVFCYGTKTGEIFGAGLTDAQRAMLREGDRFVHENVTALVDSGNEPLRIACSRGRELGLKTFARLEMNHEYGPASEDNWMWVGFVGSFNKNHPEYRIPGTVLLDFKHEAVRQFKLAIFREALEAGADGLSLDLAVYPPFFEDPEAGRPIMTAFVRDVRALCDGFSNKERRIEMMARVPARNAIELGLDWKTWMAEHLIDYIVPTHYRPNETFDLEIGEFVSMRNRTGVPVFPTIWQALGFTDTDSRPGEDERGVRRYDKPKTKEMYFAQALLLHRAGADGIQLGFSENQWVTKPWLNDLAEPEKVEFADKHYMVNVLPHCPVLFPPEDSDSGSCVETVPMRIGDDLRAATRQGLRAKTEVVLYALPLEAGERLEVYVNGYGPATGAGAEEQQAREAPIESSRIGDEIHNKEWWRRGEVRLLTSADWWRLGENEIRFEFSGASANRDAPFKITWIDLLIRYSSQQAATHEENPR